MMVWESEILTRNSRGWWPIVSSSLTGVNDLDKHV